MSKHTPGPWKAGGWSSHGTPILAADPRKEKGRTVAVVPCDYTSGIPGASGNESADYETFTTKANARLIAAAPQLLEACKDSLAWIVGVNECCLIKTRLRAAIAAAEGEATK